VERVLKLVNTYKGISQAHLGTGEAILFWDDIWNDQLLKNSFPELHSFAINKKHYNPICSEPGYNTRDVPPTTVNTTI
jgi:hypothetical protein